MTKKLIFAVVPTLLLIGFSLLASSVNPSFAVWEPANIRVLPEVVVVEQGQIFTIAVVAESVQGSLDWRYGLDVQLSWNASYLEYVSHEATIPVELYPTPISPSPYPGILHSPVIWVKDQVDEDANMAGSWPGTMYWIGVASMVPAQAFYGNGTIFTMTFRVKSEIPSGGVEFPLHVHSAPRLADTGAIVFDNVQDGLVRIRARSLSPDINGDGVVDIQDVVVAANTYGSRPGDANWNLSADIALPYDVIDIRDLVTCAAHYGQLYS